MQKIIINRDGIPYINADERTVVFGYGENAVEYSWKEIKEIIESDYSNYMSYQAKEHTHAKRN